MNILEKIDWYFNFLMKHIKTKFINIYIVSIFKYKDKF